MADSEVRQRKPQAVPEPADKSTKTTTKSDTDGRSTIYLDILRVISFLLVASCALSYVVSDGESYFWKLRNTPDYLRVDWWKAKMQGPVYMTLDELSAYDGTDPKKPLYLAINGTIYDVSAGSRMYGPGGSYHVFAGTDASRAFVTGCFAEDRTVDMRGVEEMFLPLDDPERDAHWTTAEMAELRVQEMENAKNRVHSSLKHWVDFFGKSKKYTPIGHVKREEGWLEKTPMRELCAPALKGRKKRPLPT